MIEDDIGKSILTHFYTLEQRLIDIIIINILCTCTRLINSLKISLVQYFRRSIVSFLIANFKLNTFLTFRAKKMTISLNK